ncbi:MAG: ribonuclease HII [Desulfohalobiaceae bacterium]
MLEDTANKGSGSRIRAGVDEAGRGCLAGPVVAAAVVLPEGLDLPLLTDSKKLSPSQRLALEEKIKASCLSWYLGLAWPRQIERINILQATLLAMGKALHGLRPRPDLALVDGRQAPQTEIRTSCIVRGDALHPCISAASILAKTFRDRLMQSLDRRYPGYGFAKHKGYGTRMHLESLRRLGPCALHRMSFKPLARGRENWLCLPSI